MNDLIYNELVATPGYEMDFAAGTSYSMDAEAYLAIALSMANLGEAGESETPDRLLEGIRRANKRMALFINRGGLQPPKRRNPLYAMLDKSVFEVADDSRGGNRLANFHPKIWIIKEHAADNPSRRQIKLIVMSRNLTKDSSLDIAVAMTAPINPTVDEPIRRKHEPLKKMLLRLADYASREKRKDIISLANDIDHTGAFDLDSRYTDYDFLPFHFGENLNADIDFETELPGRSMLVVSPFIDYGTLQWLNNYGAGAQKILVTRLESLTPEIMDLYSVNEREVWVPTGMMARNDVLPMNLHAKIYLSWGPRTGGTHLWLGSANATGSGFHRNSEFLLRLTLRRGQNLFKDFVGEFTDKKKQMFEKVMTLSDQPEVQPKDISLSVAVRTSLICRGNLTAEISQSENGYRIRISARRLKGIDGTVRLAPIQEPHNEAVLTAEGCEIEVAEAAHLSEFFILTVTPFNETAEPVRMAVKLPVKGIPLDRDDQIFRSIINTRDKFLTYLQMLTTDLPTEVMSLFNNQDADNPHAATRRAADVTPAIYESLLHKVAKNSDRLRDITEIAKMVDKDVVPDSFLNIASVLERLTKQLRRYE